MSATKPNLDIKSKHFKTLTLICLFGFIQNAYGQSFEWANQIKNVPDVDGGSALFSVTVDEYGNTYNVGSFSGTVDFDPGPAEFFMTAYYDVVLYWQLYILKLDVNGNFIWAKTFVAADDASRAIHPKDVVTSTAIDNGIVITGTVRGSYDFDPGVGENIVTGDSGSDIFFVKLNEDGELVWVNKLEGVVPDSEFGNGIDLDHIGNVYISGRTRTAIDFDAGPDTHILAGFGLQYDGFLMKYSIGGDFEWVKTFRSKTNSDIYDLKITDSGNIYVGGHYEDSTDFDPEAGTDWLYAPDWGGKGFAAKFNMDGDLIWAHGLDCDVDFLALDEDENLYIYGNLEDTVDFDPSAAVFELIGDEGSVYFAKYNADFELQWAKAILGDGHIFTRGIEVNFLNSIYLTGFLAVGSMDMDPSEESLIIEQELMGSYDLFIGHYDSEGVINWAASSNTIGTDLIRDLIIDEVGNSYYVGEFNNTVDFDLSAGVYELSALDERGESFVFKLGPDCYASIRNEDGTLISNQTNATYQWVDCSDSYAIIDGATDISFLPTSPGNYAVIMEKGGCIDTSDCIMLADVNLEEGVDKYLFSVYPNPANNQIQIITDANGTVQIHNAVGKLIFTVQIEKGENTCDIQTLSAGIYYLVSATLDGQRIATIKLIVY